MGQIGKRPSRKILEDLYVNKCMNLREIGEIYGVSRQRVHQWIDTYGIQRIHSQVHNKLNRLTPISKEELIYLIDTGNKVCTISRKTNNSPTAVKYLIKHYNLTDRYEQAQKRIRFKFENLPDKETLVNLYASDISVRKILDILNCSEGTFYKWIDFYEIERRTIHNPCTHARRKRVINSQEWIDKFTKDYYAMPIDELTKQYSCCRITIYNWLDKYNIDRKSHKK